MTGRLDFVRGVYVENHLPSWRGSSAFQHRVRVSRIAERQDCAYACLQFATINELGDYAQPLCGHVPPGAALDVAAHSDHAEPLASPALAERPQGFRVGSSAGFSYIVSVGPVPVSMTITGSLPVIAKCGSFAGSV